jgi:hypothetical protein
MISPVTSIIGLEGKVSRQKRYIYKDRFIPFFILLQTFSSIWAGSETREYGAVCPTKKDLTPGETDRDSKKSP